MMFALPAILDQQTVIDLINPRYCPQDNTVFYTIDANINPLQDLVNYCPQDIGVYENVVSGSPTVPSIITTDTALWLDANDSSTITLESGAVSEWRDKSGNNRHATQTTASNRPLLLADGLNGTDVIRFDGSNDFFSLASSLSNMGIRSIFVVGKKKLTNSLMMPLSNNGNTNDFCFVPWSDGKIYAAGSGYYVFTSGGSINTPYISSEVFNNSSYDLWLNGTQLSNFSVINVSNQSIFNEVGRRLGTNQYTDGDISQIIIFPRVLTQTERELVEGYLAWSTRLEGNLPSNHPYKNSYPGISVTTTLVGNIYDFDQAP